MANKLISQLQLISSVTDALMIPSDDGLQSYRFTGAQLKAFILANQAITMAMLDDDLFDDLTGVTPVVGDFLVGADASDGKNKKFAFAALKNAVVRAVGSTDTSAADDETLYLSGASFTQTLTTGVIGKRVKLIHAGTSLTQVYTLATTGGAKIKCGGMEFASGACGLYTNGEVLWLEFDGTDWFALSHYAVTDWTTISGISLVALSGGTPTNPTKPNTGQVVDNRQWMRYGRRIFVRDEYAQSSTTGANSGSGDYSSTVPGSQVMDTTKMNLYTTIEGNGACLVRGNLGQGAIGNSTVEGMCHIVPYNSTTIRYAASVFSDGGTPSRGYWSDACFGLASSSTIYMFSKWDAPIAAWLP